IALPVIIALIIAELVMGVISRSVQQFNVMLIGMPVKMLMGIMLIITVLPVIINQIQSLFSNLVDVLDGTFVFDSNVLFPVSILLSTSDKTEEPTEKKKKDERKKGNVAKSKELINALTLCGVVLIVYVMSDSIIKELKIFLVSFLTIDFNMIMSGNLVQFVFNKAMLTFMKLFIPIGMIILVLGVVGNIAQIGFLNSKDALKPQLSKLNPINGFKNMFSQTAIVNMLKSTILIIILGYIGINFIKSNYENFLKIGYVHFPYVLYSVIDIVKQLLSIALLVAVVIGVIDFAYQKYAHKKKLKMTKQEVKEEYKQMEGDPLIKSKIRQKQRQMSSQRMISNAKEATVIITNPTHISIAIRYEKGKDSAPVVVAKGADLLAKKIREIAKENEIPMIENKPLARMIYKKVDVDQEVPADMYEAVAQVLVAVYKIRNKYKKS
ncbi:MAG: flagellar biosynthesis protein FlhB, partial [Peptostreptococcaceae bacterium]